MKTTSTNKAFQQLFLTGILGWIAGSAALFAFAWFLTDHESFFELVMWSASHWWAAYGFGLVVLLVRGAMMKKSPGSALAAYLLPVGVIAATGGVCLAIYPDAGFRDELMGYLPAVLVFYVFGYLWLRAREGTSQAFARAVLPPVLGGVMILGFVAVPTFAGNAFRYRDAFVLEIVKTTNPEGFVVAEAVLEIRKPGNYKFTAPQFPAFSIGPGVSQEKATREILWGAAGEPKDGATGKFPLQIRWEKPAVRPGIPPMPGLEDAVFLEAREAGEPGVIVSTVSAPFPGKLKE
jgi:hypothetical protein